MGNEIIILKNKTNKKYNDMVDFVLYQGILKTWKFKVNSILILENEIIVKIKINYCTIELSTNDFMFSLRLHDNGYVNAFDIECYCKGGYYNE